MMDKSTSIKLCMITKLPPPYGGVANWAKLILSKIESDGDICVETINIANRKRATDGRTFFDRIIGGNIITIHSLIQIKKTINRHSVDVMHLTTSGGLGFFRDILMLHLLKMNRISCVYHLHFGRTVLYKNDNGLNWKLLRHAIRVADITIVLDDKSYGILKPYARKLYKVNNPIDTAKIEIEDIVNNKKEKVENFIYVGWVIKAKGIEELLKAFTDFNLKSNKKFRLDIVGPADQKYLEEIQKEYSNEYISFVGEVSHEEAMMRIASSFAFILPSYTEGFPNVVLEAMVQHKCIIATNVGAIPEMLADDAGIIIPCKSVEAIYDAIKRISTDEKLREYLGNNAYNRVKNLYDIGVTFNKYKEIWKEAIESQC